ncbi:hypothetical protein INR49_005797 [Caranx melampygus]|nr:hypothetical protein INR49_005797 [Caranx melampygus]
MESHMKHVKADCEKLLSRFRETDSVRFETFSKIWREMKFSQIFCGTKGHRKRAFSRLILDTAYSYFLPPFSFQIRVGGLYLLFSLYRCQTATPTEQINVALKDWADVKKFEKDAVDAQHLDVVYIFRQLKSLKAFHFTAMPVQLSYKKKKKLEKSALCEEFIARASRPQQLINIELLEELSNIHELYEKLKSSVSSTTELSDSSINLISKDLIPQLRGTVVDFYKWQQKECSSRAELLASIKSRAYGQAAEAAKSRRHRQVEVDFTSAEAGPSSTPGSSRISKPSLKVRTKENVQISAAFEKETIKLYAEPNFILRRVFFKMSPV